MAKTHVCLRMIEYIENQGITVSKWEETAKRDGINISVGYLRKALKKNTNIGFEILDYFLMIFPDVDIYWLLQIDKSKDMEKKPTSVPKEAAIPQNTPKGEMDYEKTIEGLIAMLREDNQYFKEQNKQLFIDLSRAREQYDKLVTSALADSKK